MLYCTKCFNIVKYHRDITAWLYMLASAVRMNILRFFSTFEDIFDWKTLKACNHNDISEIFKEGQNAFSYIQLFFYKNITPLVT